MTVEPIPDGAEGSEASLRPALDELHRLFHGMKLWFKPQELPLPVIAIQSKGRRNALGWFCDRRWGVGQGGEGQFHELTICAEGLARGVFDVVETLLHEMVHLSNYLAGLRDCSSNQYHNKRFRDRAESVGLLCERGPHGWAETSLSAEARRKLEQLSPDPGQFLLFRVAPAAAVGGEAPGRRSKASTKLSKWACSCTSVWAASGREVKALCTSCGGPWVRQAPSGTLVAAGPSVGQGER